MKQAILESEATEIEETMLRDKLAESETKQLEDCIAEHVLRESLLEHIKVQVSLRIFWKCCFVYMKRASSHRTDWLAYRNLLFMT